MLWDRRNKEGNSKEMKRRKNLEYREGEGEESMVGWLEHK